MRILSLTAAAVAVLLSLPASTDQAQAFGDVCLRDVSVRGSVQGSMSSARGAARAAWADAVTRKHGARFADWYYSADRTFECSWNSSGTQIRCLARAIPCGRR